MRRLTLAALICTLGCSGCITVQAPPPPRCPPCQQEAPGTEPRGPAPKLPARPDIQQVGEVRQ